MPAHPHSVEVDFHFQAARRLDGLPAGHPCARPHGGSFQVTLSVSGPLQPNIGWVQDFGEIEAAIAPVREALDHRDLNQDVEGLGNPTSERLAQWIYERLHPTLPGLQAVCIAEAPTTRCRYSPGA